MNDAQRVHWLAAGIIVSPGTYNDLLRDFAEEHKYQIRRLAEFFYPEHSMHSMQFSIDELGIASLELLIRLVGSYVGPDLLNADGWVTPAMQASRLVNDLIQRLAASPTKDASKTLAALLADPALSRWCYVLSRVQDAQRVIWRDASYRHPTIEQVCQTLNGGTPANAADLAALVMDRIWMRSLASIQYERSHFRLRASIGMSIKDNRTLQLREAQRTPAAMHLLS